MNSGAPDSLSLDGTGRRFGIVAARFHGAVVDRLLAGAEGALRGHGVAQADIAVVRVPGAWEIPVALDELARRGGFSALIALGVLIRGGTLHFEVIAEQCSRGIAEVALRRELPVTFGVLTCETMAQAEARAGGEEGNKGEEAAFAALEMASLVARLRT
ncbi:MAG: 6,7-dimethyl-8-ribityllumazine synthase [Thermoanaerobaculia bacterium]